MRARRKKHYNKNSKSHTESRILMEIFFHRCMDWLIKSGWKRNFLHNTTNSRTAECLSMVGVSERFKDSLSERLRFRMRIRFDMW